MGKIIDVQNLDPIKQAKRNGTEIILTGGCFDILHEGHMEFLARAKDLGGKLLVMVESDLKVKQLKGGNRPINSQSTRSQALSELDSVDIILPLPFLPSDHAYADLVKLIEPDIIAITAGEKIFPWEKDYKIVEVIKRLKEYSTTKLAHELEV